MAGFIRRFTQDPGVSEITAVEGVVIIDREPPGNIQGASTGVVIAVGEFEDGPFNTPFEVSSGEDLRMNFGGFGYTYDGVGGHHPAARVRLADGAVKPEYWNGNGFLALTNKRFSRLIVTRVDTTVGEVQFTRMASVLGAAAFTYQLANSQSIGLVVDNPDGAQSPARIDSNAGNYPTQFGGGEQMSIEVDGGGVVVVTFQAADQSQQQVIARINAALGYEAASDIGGGITQLRSASSGPTSSIETSAVDVTVSTAVGFTASGVVNGTNNTVTASFSGGPATLSSNAGNYPTGFIGGESMTLTTDSGTSRQIGPVTVTFQSTDQTHDAVCNRINEALGYTAAVPNGANTDITGRVAGTSGGVTINSVSAQVTAAVGFTPSSQSGSGNVGDTSQVTFAEVKAIVESTIAGTTVEQTAAGQLRISANESVLVATLTANGLGFTVGDVSFATGSEEDSSIPAGTRVTDGATVWVTAGTVAVPAGDAGPFTARVRPGDDDGSAAGAAVGTVQTMVAPLQSGAFKVTNITALTPALSEAAVDAAYVAALSSTLNANSVARQGNLIFCARQSNAVRTALRQNALDAAAEGLAGRMAIIRPPLGTTTRAQALSTIAQPGVGAYRSERVIYAYPGVAASIPQIAARGLSGGVGFTADGVVDLGFDSWVASVCSRLPPEENPGQLTAYTAGIQSVEQGNPDVQDLKVNDYKAFRQGGIAALRIDDGTAIIQSGVTSVNPVTFPNLRNIARRRMADFLQDSMAPRMKAFSKKLNTRQRRALLVGEVEGYLASLKSVNNPSTQRIADYLVDAVTGNTQEGLAMGIFRIIIKVRTLSSLDFIVLETEIGEGVVTIAEAA